MQDNGELKFTIYDIFCDIQRPKNSGIELVGLEDSQLKIDSLTTAREIWFTSDCILIKEF